MPLLSSLLFSTSDHRLRAGWRLLAHLVMLAALLVSVAIFLAPLPAVFGLVESDDSLFLLDAIGSLFAITASVFLARRWFDHRALPPWPGMEPAR